MYSSNTDEDAVAPHFRNIPCERALTSMKEVPALKVIVVEDDIEPLFVTARARTLGTSGIGDAFTSLGSACLIPILLFVS